jgi:filamentous hemagglutinin family protein
MKQHNRAKTLQQTCKGITRNLATAILLAALAATSSHALPQNGSVAGGSATISQPNSSTMNINQTSGNAIINWQGYSIGANESVRYIQPGSSSIALNRVTGADPSYIYGHLSGNGQVWVINPNGLLVGPGAIVQTSSFLASTMNITDENFMSGRYLFSNSPDSQVSIINQGLIQAADGGYVVLAAPSVTNSGSIVANVGKVHLASGDTITLSIDNGSLINAAVSGDVAESALGVTNTGHITTDGGQVVLTARVAGDIMKNIVNNEGIIEAKSIIEKDGIIILDGGDHGITANSGTLDASGKNPGETGGSVTVVGDKVGLFAGSTVDVSGDAGGGMVLIGGNFHGAGPEKNASMTYVDKDAAITADALVNGDGGTVVVWSDDTTRFNGTISARGGVQGGDGGRVEVSGKHGLMFDGSVNTTAAHGKMGSLLLDPDNITIIAGNNSYSGTTDLSVATGTSGVWGAASDPGTQTIGDQFISALLADTSVILQATNTITANSGVAVNWGSANSLTLEAGTNITLNNASFTAASGSLNLNFGQGNVSGTLALGTSNLAGVGSVTTKASSTGLIPGNYTISRAGGNTWNLTGANAGIISGAGAGGGALVFSNARNLTDTGAGVFNMNGGSNGSVLGTISAVNGTVDYTGYGSAPTFDLNGGASTGMGGWTGITTVTGRGTPDGTIAGTGRTYNLTGANAGNSGAVSWTLFGQIADNGTGTITTTGGQTYNLTGVNSGNVTTLLPGGFTGIRSLTDTGAGIFRFGAAGSVAGNISALGGTLDYDGHATAVNVNLVGSAGASTSIGGTWSGITSVIGSSNTTDTITGTSQTYNLDNSTANKGSNGGVTWTAIENLTDTGTGTFNMGASGHITGNINGGSGGTLDYSSYSGPVILNLAGTGTTGIDGTWSNIASVAGNAVYPNFVTGSGKTYTLDNSIADKGSSGGVTWTAFKNITDTGTGIFNMGTGGSVTGNLDGGSGGTLNFGSYTSPVTLNLAGTGTTGIGSSWSHIATVTGNTATSNTVTGLNKTYILDNSTANKGSNGGVTWTAFRNITDTGTGIFNMGTGGSVTGNLDGGVNGTLDYSSYGNPVTLNLSGTGTTGITTGTWSHIASVIGNAATSNTVIGSNKTYILDNSIANKGSNSGVTWTGFGNITDTGTGIFNMGTGGSVSGNLDGGIGGTLIYNSYINPVTLVLAGTGTTGIATGTWSGITTVAGSSNNDTVSGTGRTYNLTAAGAGNSGGISWTSFEKVADSGTGTIATAGGRTYTLTGANSGTVVTLLPGGYTGIANLTDSGAGIFMFGATGSISGNISAVNGSLNYSGATGPVAVNLTATTGSGIGGTWNGITSMTGSGASDTMGGTNATYNLTAANAGNSNGVSWTSFESIADSGTGTIATAGGRTYTLTGANSGTVATLLPGGYTGIGNLADSGAGSFRFAAGGSITGGITAASGTLDYSTGIAGPVTVDLTARTGSGIGGTWDGITTVTGSGASDTMGGANATYNLTAADSGNSGGVSWTSFENLHDTAAGTFMFGASGTVTGNISAANGALDYSAGIAGPVTVDLTAKTGSGIGGTWDGITTVTGSGASDTMGGTNATYNLTAANAGNSNGVSWSSFENIADSGTGTIATAGGQTYNLTGANSGTVAALLPGGYTGIGNLADSGAGSFRFAGGGSVTGGITASGGVLDYSAGIAGPVAVDLTARTGSGIGGTWDGITTVTGSGAADTMGGTNATYNLTAANAGNSNGVSWSSFENIADSGTGTIATAGGQTYNLTGANSGTVAALLPGGYTGIGNLADSGAGSFRFAGGGSVTGGITASGGVLDYSAGIAGPVAVDLTARTGSGIGGTWDGITTVTGSGAADTMGGANAVYNLTAADSGNSGGVSWTSFENLHDTAAGIFTFGASGTVTGNISAANGALDYSAGIAGPVTVDLTAKTGSGIGGTWDGIATLIGTAHASDTITGSSQTFSLTGADAGNNGSVSWTSFENINGLAGINSYVGSGGSLSGTIVAAGTAAVLQSNIQTGGAQTYAGAVTLGADTTLTSTGSGPITFAGTLDSDSTARNLTVATSGITTFGAAVGTTPLNSLTINGGGTTNINGGSVTTSGASGQMYNSAVVLGADTTLIADSGAITLGDAGSLTTSGLLTTRSGTGQTLVGNGTSSIASFNATNATSGDIILTNNAAPLTITGINQTGGQLILTNSGAITGSGPLTVSGATAISAAGQPITLTNVDNDFSGTVTVSGGTTTITDRNNLAVALNTTGPTTLTAGANMNVSGISTDSVSVTAVDTVTLANPSASILHITGASIVGTMNNSSPLDLTTTSGQAVSVNLTGSLPFLTFAGDIRTNIRNLGLYNGAVVMGSEMDHFISTIGLRTSTKALAVSSERLDSIGMLARFDEFFKADPMESIIDSEGAFTTPEPEPELIDSNPK